MSTNTSEKYNFSYDYRLQNPDSEETEIADRLVNNLFNQTALVNMLFEKKIIWRDDVHNLYVACEMCKNCLNDGYENCDNEQSQEIFQWVLYTNFFSSDAKKLDAAGIPYIDNEYGTWIGLTSYGTAWTVYVATSLCNALYNTPDND